MTNGAVTWKKQPIAMHTCMFTLSTSETKYVTLGIMQHTYKKLQFSTFIYLFILSPFFDFALAWVSYRIDTGFES